METQSFYTDIYHVYTAPDCVNATENWEPHSTFMTPRLCKDSIFIGTLQPSLPPRPKNQNNKY